MQAHEFNRSFLHAILQTQTPSLMHEAIVVTVVVAGQDAVSNKVHMVCAALYMAGLCAQRVYPCFQTRAHSTLAPPAPHRFLRSLSNACRSGASWFEHAQTTMCCSGTSTRPGPSSGASGSRSSPSFLRSQPRSVALHLSCATAFHGPPPFLRHRLPCATAHVAIVPKP